MRKLLSGTLGMGLAAAMVMACGDDTASTSASDASANAFDGSSPVADGQSPPATDASAASDSEAPALDGSSPVLDGSGASPVADGQAPGVDASDGGCNFATFVLGLVATDTTMTALPSTNLGQACTDDQNQAEFQSLFP